MLRISKLTDYATALLTHMAVMPDRQVSAQQLATESRLPLPTVAALLKRLGRAGLVHGSRGAAGGYSLARPPQEISVAEVIGVIEGPVALTECALGDGNCSLESDCATRANWRQISRAVQVALESVSLADMARPVSRTVKFMPLRQRGLKELS
jgi:FeS assembly SUF system regulator